MVTADEMADAGRLAAKTDCFFTEAAVEFVYGLHQLLFLLVRGGVIKEILLAAVCRVNVG